MCIEALVIRGASQIACENQGDLRVALGCDLVMQDGVQKDAYRHSACLCPVDLKRTAEKAGVRMRVAPERGGWSGEAIFIIGENGAG